MTDHFEILPFSSWRDALLKLPKFFDIEGFVPSYVNQDLDTSV